MLPILLGSGAVSSFHVGSLHALPMFNATHRAAALRRIIDQFSFRCGFSGIGSCGQRVIVVTRTSPHHNIGTVTTFGHV